MSNELRELVERFRGYRMSEEEPREQAIDFAYGNGHFEDPRVTLEGVAVPLISAVQMTTLQHRDEVAVLSIRARPKRLR